MNDYFSTSLVDFSELKIRIHLPVVDKHFLEQIGNTSILRRMANGLFTLRKEKGKNTLYAFSTESEEPLAEKLPIEEIQYQLIKSVFTTLHRSFYRNVRVFPTERTALVTLPFASQSNRKELLHIDKITIDAFEKLFQGNPQLSELKNEGSIRRAIGPVGNFLNMMRTIFLTGTRQIKERERRAESDPTILRYIELADILENQVLAGKLTLSTPEPDSKRDIHFQATQNMALDIPIVSSMVKELAPLVLYLRYLAEPEELLIIDEPEMNLHPIAQVRFIEFLAMLVNAGLHVLITTHSTYLIDHLTNLMDAYKHKQHAEIAEKFLLESKDAFIAQEQASVYLIANGEAQNILNTEEGVIDWTTFSDVTKVINRIQFELLGEEKDIL